MNLLKALSRRKDDEPVRERLLRYTTGATFGAPVAQPVAVRR